MELDLAGKAFLITGGSAGLGFALARALVGEGAAVALLAREAGRLLHAAEALREAGGDVLQAAGDARSPDDLAAFVSSAIERWGRIDGVVNNAGELAAGRFEQHQDSVWEQDLALKLMGAVRLIRVALPYLRDSAGSIVNTLSITGKAPDAGSTPTSVSRGAGLALTKALSKELAGDGVRVNAVMIGVMESAQLERLADARGVTPQAYYESMVKSAQIPLGRVGHPHEYAELVSFLLSPRAAYITGAAINLDGGLCPVV